MKIYADEKLLEKVSVQEILKKLPKFNEGKVTINDIEVIYELDDEYNVNVFEEGNDFLQVVEINDDEVFDNKKYCVRDREAGNIIEVVETYEDGEKLIESFEEDDKENDVYEENFYEVAEISKFEYYYQKSNLTLTEIANKTGIAYRTIQDYKSGARDLNKASGINLYKLSIVFDCKIEDLLDL